MKKYSFLVMVFILSVLLIAGCGGGGGSTGVVPNNVTANPLEPTATPGTLVQVPNNPTNPNNTTIPSNLPTGNFKVDVKFPGAGSDLRAKELTGSDLPYNAHTLRVTITGEAITTSIVGERNDLDPSGAGTYTLTVSNVPVGLNTATIEVLDPSGNLLCQRKHGFYMTPGATEGPGLILLGVAIQGDGSYVPVNIDIPAGSSISFQNHDYVNDRTASMNGGSVTVGPIGHATHITQPVTAEVFPALDHLFGTAGEFNYDGQSGRVLVYGLPTLTSVTPDKDSANGTSSVIFTLTGTNFGTSQTSVNGEVRFIQVNENDPNNPWGTVINPSSFTSWTNTSIAGSINLPSGKYRIEVSIRGENTTEAVFFYKGTGTYQVIVGDTGDLVNLAEDFDSVTDNNSGNLRFGYKTSLESTNFTGYTDNTPTQDQNCPCWKATAEDSHIWKNIKNYYWSGIAPGHVSLHPGIGTEVAVVRWVSSLTGNVNIAGTFGQGNTGDVNVYIVKNNSTTSALFETLHTSSDAPFDLNIPVVQGDTIDFMVYNGGDWSGDDTQLDLIIKQNEHYWNTVQAGDGTTTSTLYGVHFTDSSKGWAVGAGGTIKHTTDGGNTWNSQTSGTTSILRDVHFVDASNGWATGASGTIKHTTDGGNTWNSQTSGTTNNLYDIQFLNGNNGWAVGRNGTVLHTTDGGNIWTAMPVITDNNYLYGVHFVNSNKGWSAGTDINDYGVIYYTEDGGNTWIVQGGYGNSLNKIYFTDENHGWAICETGEVLYTTNGGNVWDIHYRISDVNLYGIHFVDANKGWASGNDGRILYTPDGGQNWNIHTSVSPPGVPNEIRSIYFTDETHGWAVGRGGIILKYY